MLLSNHRQLVLIITNIIILFRKNNPRHADRTVGVYLIYNIYTTYSLLKSLM